MPDRSRLIYRMLTVAALLGPGHFAPTPARAQPAPVVGKKFAFLVGVELYEHTSLRELKYAGDDVSELAALLGKSGYESVVLTAETGARDGRLVPNRPTSNPSCATCCASANRPI